MSGYTQTSLTLVRNPNYDKSSDSTAARQSLPDRFEWTVNSNADDILNKARRQAEQITGDARARAESLERDAQERHRQAMGSLVQQREVGNGRQRGATSRLEASLAVDNTQHAYPYRWP